MRVLIVRLSAMGDTVCTLPVATAIKHNQPEAHVTWVVDKRFSPLVQMCPDVDEVLVYDPKKPVETTKALKAMEPFDFAFDMQGLFKSGRLVGAATAKEKLGFHWQREGARLFSSPVKPDKSSVHVVDQYVDVARAAGFEADRAEFVLRPSQGSVDQRDTLLSGIKDYAVIHCGGGWATKRWDPAHFASICTLLATRGLTPILIGAKSEEEAGKEVLTLAPVALSFIGKTNLEVLTSLIQGAKLYVGGDTGATHIAAAFGVPCVGIYLVTRPERSCPYGQFSNCPTPTLDKVTETVERLLA